MPFDELVDDFPQEEGRSDHAICDLCGAKMVKVGGCYFCNRCGQKKCNTDLT